MVEKKPQRKTLKAMIRYPIVGSDWSANAETLYKELSAKKQLNELQQIPSFQIILKDLPDYVAEGLAAAAEHIRTKNGMDIAVIHSTTFLQFLEYPPHRFFDRIVDQEQKQALPKVVETMGELIKNGFQTEAK